MLHHLEEKEGVALLSLCCTLLRIQLGPKLAENRERCAALEFSDDATALRNITPECIALAIYSHNKYSTQKEPRPHSSSLGK